MQVVGSHWQRPAMSWLSVGQGSIGGAAGGGGSMLRVVVSVDAWSAK